jgi:hypothetical protein
LLQRIRRDLLRYDVARGDLLALDQRRHTRHDDLLREPLLVSSHRTTAPPPTPVQTTPNKESSTPNNNTIAWWDDDDESSTSLPVQDLESSVPRTTTAPKEP